MKSFRNWVIKESNKVFLGKSDLQHALNMYINQYVLRDLDNEITYVEIPESKNVIQIYHKSLKDSISSLIVQAINFYASEIGLKLGKIFKNEEYYIIPIKSYPKFDDTFSHVTDPVAKKKLIQGNMIDVNDIGHEVEPGVFKLNRFIPNANYFDSKNNKRIYSIGRDSTGEIFAALDTRFYNNDDYETLYLR